MIIKSEFEKIIYDIPKFIINSDIFINIKKIKEIKQFEEVAVNIFNIFGMKFYLISSNIKLKNINSNINIKAGNFPDGMMLEIKYIIKQMSLTSSGSIFYDGLPREMQLPIIMENDVVAAGAQKPLRTIFLTVPASPTELTLIVLSGSRHPFLDNEMVTLQFWVNVLIQKLNEIELRKFQASINRLTSREKECLEWTAKGKTSAEIGIILGLSEHTINNYIINACRRVNATNRSHAVYLAMKYDLIN